MIALKKAVFAFGILPLVVVASACSPGLQQGTGLSGADSAGIPNTQLGEAPELGGTPENDALDARLAACNLTESETQDLEYCSQVLSDAGVWLATCNDGIKTPCGTLLDDRCNRDVEPRNRRGRQRHARYCRLKRERDEQTAGLIQAIADFNNQQEETFFPLIRNGSFLDPALIEAAFAVTRQGNSDDAQQDSGQSGTEDGGATTEGGVCSIADETAADFFRCVNAVKNDTLEDCSSAINDRCGPLLCTRGLMNRAQLTTAEDPMIQSFCAARQRAVADNPPESPEETPAAQSQSESAPEVTSLTVKIKTADVRNAGTDATIKLFACPYGNTSNQQFKTASVNRLKSELGCHEFALDNEGRDDFERNALDTFTLDQAAGTLNEYNVLILESNNRGRHAG